jgi:hypothetical protein
MQLDTKGFPIKLAVKLIQNKIVKKTDQKK